MKCWIGIDLGSTTTKAVVLDDRARLLGRGITNSRSNYAIACLIAKTEALINARFALFERLLADAGLAESERAALADELGLAFRREQYIVQLRALRAAVGDELEAPRLAAIRDDAARKSVAILASMDEAADELYSPGAKKKSDFFRDVATSLWMQKAEAEKCECVGFETLMSLFDKAILRVENTDLDLSFSANVGPALDYVLTRSHERFAHVESDVRRMAQRAADSELVEASVVGTGYGRTTLPFAKENIRSEILCHGLGAHWMFPGTRTVLDIGGQDTKAVQVDADGIVTSFQMNDRCAAGCGRYLGYIADEMNLGLHELGPMAQKSTCAVKITSTCTVFAGAELRDRLALGDRREDILAGLHRAMMLRAMSLLARSGGVKDEFTFTGGVAKNPAAVDALRRLVKQNYGLDRINISADSIYTGAIGAALFAQRAVRPSPAPVGRA